MGAGRFLRVRRRPALAYVVEAHHGFAVRYSSGAGEQPVVAGLWKAGVTMGGKYESQQKYNRKTYVRFPLDLKPDVLAAFRTACEKNETTPTTEIKKFIASYIDKNKAGE